MRRLFAAFLVVVPALAGTLQHAAFQRELETLAAGFDGRVGACVEDSSGRACLQPDARFSMQSVVKLLAGLATMDAVDRAGWRLDQPVLVRRQDLSLYMQPLAQLVTGEGYRTTIGDLVHRAVVESDSAANDILIARLGGPAAVQSCLNRLGIQGVRIDRDERHLQTEIAGIEWRPDFVDPKLLDAAIAAVPKELRELSYRKYQTDPRDTATPRGMSALLHALAAGKLLSPASTRHLIGVMEQTVTFPDRLKAGAAPGWKVAHKTGTSGSWDGVTAATNDVGIFTAPDGGTLAIAAFIADTRAPSKDRATLMQQIAAAAVAHYRQDPGTTAK